MNAIIPSFFKHKRPSNLLRIGRPYDGGYTITVNDIKKTGHLISLGIGDDWSFESEFNLKNESNLPDKELNGLDTKLDNWLSTKCTCPLCRQLIVNS